MKVQIFTNKLTSGAAFLLMGALSLIVIYNFRVMDVNPISKIFSVLIFTILAFYCGSYFFDYKPRMEFDDEKVVVRNWRQRKTFYFADMAKFQHHQTFTRGGRNNYIYFFPKNSPEATFIFPMLFIRGDAERLAKELNEKINAVKNRQTA